MFDTFGPLSIECNSRLFPLIRSFKVCTFSPCLCYFLLKLKLLIKTLHNQSLLFIILHDKSLNIQPLDILTLDLAWAFNGLWRFWFGFDLELFISWSCLSILVVFNHFYSLLPSFLHNLHTWTKHTFSILLAWFVSIFGNFSGFKTCVKWWISIVH